MAIDYTKKQAIITKATKSLVDELLERNTNNRNVKKSHKAWLAKAIQDGEFILTGQGIAVSKEGVLVDGQHRLMAIKEGGYPAVELLVVTGLEGKSMQYVDMHAKRSTADMLRIVLDKSITTRMAATIRAHLSIVETTEGFNFVKDKPSLEDYVGEMDKHSDFLELLSSAGGTKPRAGTYCAFFHYGLKVGQEKALLLAEKVNTGERLVRTDPAYKLRQILNGGNRKSSYGASGQLLDYGAAVAACIADFQDEQLEILRPANSWRALGKVTSKAAQAA